MRMSTSTIFDLGVASIQQQTSAMVKTQQQIASGRRILTPEDDPVASARVLEVSQAKALNQQYDVNANSATSALGLEETALQSVDNLLLDVRTAIISTANPSLESTGFTALATGLRGRYQELLGLANSTDGNGQYIFSGYKGSTQPFSQIAPGNVSYNGDQGQRLIQIAPSRQIAVSDAGMDVFTRIKNGNGVFVTAAAAGNTGSGLISPGSGASYDGNRYQVSFNVVAGVTTYDVAQWNTATSAYDIPVSAATPYTSGNTITVGGGQFEIKGSPANGDTFTVQPSTNESLFATINNFITALESAAVSGNRIALTNSMTAAISNLDNGLQRVLTVHASVGTRMQEIEAVKSNGEDTGLQYEQTLSNLQDVDYAKAITDLTQQQMGLEAAQKTFQKIQTLSLFNYI